MFSLTLAKKRNTAKVALGGSPAMLGVCETAVRLPSTQKKK
jgi:hypothetical protein